MGAEGGREAYKTLRVDDWNEYARCPVESCQAPRGENCWANHWDRSKRQGGRTRRKTAHPERAKVRGWPEHEKLALLDDKLGTLDDFLNWLEKDHATVMTTVATGTGGGIVAISRHPKGEWLQDRLHEFFQIDRDKLAEELEQITNPKID